MTKLVKVFARAGRKVVRPVIKAAQKVKTNKPEIFLTVGLTATFVSLVWVAIESTKAPDVMATGNEKLDKLKNYKDEVVSGRISGTIDGEPTTITVLSDEAKIKELKKVNKDILDARLESIWYMSRLYIGPLIVFLLGGALIVKGHNIIRKQNLVLAGALKGTEELFKFYRSNVIEAEGEEADQRYLRGIKDTVEITELKHDKDGKEVLTRTSVPIIKDHENPWRFKYTPQYFRTATGDMDHDITHIKNVEYYFNRKYGGSKKHGMISMYEVLDYLDPIWEEIDPDGTREIFCREYGWGHDANGDDIIDLGVYRAINDAAIKGIGDAVYIECNCDGRLADLKNQYKERYVK